MSEMESDNLNLDPADSATGAGVIKIYAKEKDGKLKHYIFTNDECCQKSGLKSAENFGLKLKEVYRDFLQELGKVLTERGEADNKYFNALKISLMPCATDKKRKDFNEGMINTSQKGAGVCIEVNLTDAKNVLFSVHDPIKIADFDMPFYKDVISTHVIYYRYGKITIGGEFKMIKSIGKEEVNKEGGFDYIKLKDNNKGMNVGAGVIDYTETDDDPNAFYDYRLDIKGWGPSGFLKSMMLIFYDINGDKPYRLELISTTNKLHTKKYNSEGPEIIEIKTQKF